MEAPLPIHLEEIDGVHLAFALDLPGCYAEGATEAMAIANAPVALAAYRDWRARHDAPIPAPPAAVRVVEHVPSRRLADGYEVNALFAPERRSPDAAFLALGHRLLVAADADVRAALEAIPEAGRDRAPNPGERTPRQVAEHVAQAGWWYLTQVADVPPRPPVAYPAGSAARVAAVHAAILDRLATASPARLAAVTVSQEEEWSVRKLLRRALWHARTHAAELRRVADR